MTSMLGSRIARVACVVLAGAIATTCVRTNTERCSDGTRCAEGTTCIEIPDSESRCARPDQFTACGGNESGPCSSMGLDGVCLGGACFVAICGDGVVDPPEVCDDGNTTDGDDCSASCRSDESCGNGRIDLIAGEQCDEGIASLSGDGCTSKCLREIRLWRDVTPGAPPPRSAHGLVTDPIGGVLLYGGANGASGASFGSSAAAGAFNDTWRWDGSSWRNVTPPTNAPRRAHVAIAYDPRRKVVVMFGGVNANAQVTNDTWEWDGVSWRERMIDDPPLPRAGASLACNMTACFLFGGSKGTDTGSGAGKFFNDTWRYDGATWTPVPTLMSPSTRWHAGMVHDAARNVFMLFAGQTGLPAGLNSETWELLPSGWTQRTATINVIGTAFPPLAFDERSAESVPVTMTPNGTHRLPVGATAWTTQNSFPGPLAPQFAFDRAAQRIISIGLNLGDDWIVSSLDAVWSVTPRVLPNTNNARTSMAYDPLRGIDVMLSDRGTWEWDGRNLYRVVAALPPGMKAQGAGIAFDRACGVMYAAGGGNLMSISNQTWTYDPMTRAWSAYATAQLPIALTRFAMVYDEKRGVVVAFGGSTTTGLTGGLYELTGACGSKSWQLVTPPGSSPDPREDLAMAFDARRGVTVLFGGNVSANATPTGDTWEWNGVAWNNRTTPGSPAERFAHAMAYDPRRQRVVLFGGDGAAGRFDDTWEWNGDIGAWERLTPATNPAARSSMPLAQDVTGNLVAIGGEGASGNPLFDVLRLSTELSSEKREACLLATADDDLDGLASCADPDCAGRCAPTCPIGQSCPTEPRCGDSVCSAVEDYLLCPADCPAPL